jgi:uncharacterized protein (DUF1330 family)
MISAGDADEDVRALRRGELMSAYLVVEVEVHDPERYEKYKTMVPPSLAEYGGRFLVRGGRVETLEGDWSPQRFVMVEFPSVEKAKAWWDSVGYAEAKALRQATAKTRMIVVEGVEGH